MSARGNICIKVDPKDFNLVNEKIEPFNEKVTSESPYIYIYNHFDSYPEGLGVKLKSEYNSYEKALELILEGDCSCPGNPYLNHGDKYEFVHPRVVSRVYDAYEQEYLYVFTDNKWECWGTGWLDLDKNNILNIFN